MRKPITNEELAQACVDVLDDGRRMDYWLFREAAARLRMIETVAMLLEEYPYSENVKSAIRLLRGVRAP